MRLRLKTWLVFAVLLVLWLTGRLRLVDRRKK